MFNLAGLQSTDEDKLRFSEGPLCQHSVAFIVADGVGGRDGGRWAAERAAERLGSEIYDLNSKASVDAAVTETSNFIRNEAPEPWQPATTAAGVALSENRIVVFGVGDSRVYGFDEAGITQLTVDHRSRTDSRAITRFLGGPPFQCIPDTCELDWATWHGFLICSDGFYDCLSTIDLGLLREISPPVALDELMQLALERGSTDNLTAVYVVAS